MSSGSPVVVGTLLDAGRVSRRTIVLVHGTWGRGFFPKRRDASLYPPNKRWWFEEGSQFRMRLDEALKAASLDWQIRAFLWSGANSVHARDCAASELSHQLTIDLQDPEAKVVIVAHSHGGNVALRALQRLDSKAGKIKVVTSATPFLRVFARRSWQLPLGARILVYAAMFMIVGLTTVLPIIGLGREQVGSVLEYHPLVAKLVLATVEVLLGAAGIFIGRWLIAVLSKPQAALAIERAAGYDTRGASASRMLIIRGVDDEASLSLAVGSIGSRLSYLVLTWVIPGIYVMILLAMMLLYPVLRFSIQGDAW
jgi:pimeloyl-ACP methyl ester carboxylesterase